MAVDVKDLEGKEIADDYVRGAGTENRWGEACAVFTGSFGKIVLINLLMLLFCAPAVAILIVRNVFINFSGTMYPFNANTGLGYPAYPDMAGMTETIYLTADLTFYAMIIASGFIAAIGIAGGLYSIKKLLNTPGKFTFKGFFHGVKVGYFKALFPVILFLLCYYATVLVGDWKDIVIAKGGSGAGPITAYVFIIIATILVGFYCAWLLVTGISYRMKFTKLLKNSLLFLISSPIQSLVFAAFALIPVWLYLLGSLTPILLFIAYGILLFFGLSFIALVWTGFSQWVFDTYVPPEVKKEEKTKKGVQEVFESEEDAEKRIARELLAAGKSELIGKPILPIGDKISVTLLKGNFTRADIGAVADEKVKLSGEIAAYESKHMNDPVYAEYNKLFADREKALPTPEGKKGKKKRISANNLLK